MAELFPWLSTGAPGLIQRIPAFELEALLKVTLPSFPSRAHGHTHTRSHTHGHTHTHMVSLSLTHAVTHAVTRMHQVILPCFALLALVMPLSHGHAAAAAAAAASAAAEC